MLSHTVEKEFQIKRFSTSLTPRLGNQLYLIFHLNKWWNVLRLKQQVSETLIEASGSQTVDVPKAMFPFNINKVQVAAGQA